MSKEFKRIVVSNQLWQGSGITNEIAIGNSHLVSHFENEITNELKVDNTISATEYDIVSYQSILNNFKSYKDVLSVEQPDYIVTIGGDCGVEPIPVSYLNERFDNLGVIWIDAHADLNTPTSSPSKHFHGMPLRLLLGEGEINLAKQLYTSLQPKQVFLIGVRDLDEAEKEYIKTKSIYLVGESNYNKLHTELTKRHIKKLYIHFDVDALDPQEFSFVKCPVANGLIIEEVASFIQNLCNDFEVVGKSITEVTADNTKCLSNIKSILDVLTFDD